MRVILIVVFLTTTIQVFADYGTRYFLKCKITTSDTSITGYLYGPYEYLDDTTLLKFKKNNKYFQKIIVRDLNNMNGKPAIGIADFVYIHEYSGGKALFVSEKSVSVKVKDIRSLELYDIIAFHFEPSHVISTLQSRDTLWAKKQPRQIIHDKEIDDCCPNKFLIYDDTKNYKQIVANVISEKDPEIRRKLLKELRQHKIIALKICWCG
jgi:hypothetical protein